MPRIGICGLEVQSRIGVGADERAKAQTLFCDLRLEYGRAASEPDEARTVVDYAELAASVKELAGNGERALIETLAEQVVALLLEFDPRVRRAYVAIRKPAAVAEAAYAYCELERAAEQPA
jgi:dihydroneopterin aldolase